MVTFPSISLKKKIFESFILYKCFHWSSECFIHLLINPRFHFCSLISVIKQKKMIKTPSILLFMFSDITRIMVICLYLFLMELKWYLAGHGCTYIFSYALLTKRKLTKLPIKTFLILARLIN